MADNNIGVTDFPIPQGGFQPTPPMDPSVSIPGLSPGQTMPQMPGLSPSPIMPMMGMPGMDLKFAEAEFVINSEEVMLPSRGLFYSNRKASVMVQHLTAKDEDILVSDTLRRKGTQFDVLLRKKIVDQDIDINTMLSGDKMAILIWLRRNGYGADYHVEVRDPQTLETFPAIVDLLKIKEKEVSHVPDQDGMFTYKLPICGKTVRFRLLNDREALDLETQIEGRAKMMGGIEQTVTMTLRSQIQEVDGNKDKFWIEKFVDNMQMRDSRRLQLFMGEVLPGLDMSYTFTNPNTGRTFQTGIPITMELFYPTQGL